MKLQTSMEMDHNWLMVSGLWSALTVQIIILFTGIGFTQTTDDPDLYLARGNVYEFVNNMDNHPFRIQRLTEWAHWNSIQHWSY